MLLLAPVISFFTGPFGKYVAMGIAVLLVVYGIFHAGETRVQRKWDSSIALAKSQKEVLVAKEETLTAKSEIVFVDKVRTVLTKGDTIVKYVPTLVNVTDDKNCTVPNSFVLQVDTAARNLLIPTLDALPAIPALPIYAPVKHAEKAEK